MIRSNVLLYLTGEGDDVCPCVQYVDQKEFIIILDSHNPHFWWRGQKLSDHYCKLSVLTDDTWWVDDTNMHM